MNSDPISLPLHIPATALVLDIGSGHRPHPRADVLCEKYLEDDTERGSRAIIDRPLVPGDAHALPFRDGAFGYVITRHILEHLDDPPAFFAEIQRVAGAGYIETPSLIWEYIHPVRKYHKWVLVKRDGVLHMAPKPHDWYDAVVGTTLEQLGFNSLEYGLLIRAYTDLFYVRYEWRGDIRFRVYDSIEHAPLFFYKPWDTDTARPYIPARGSAQQVIGLLRNLTGSIVHRALRGLVIRQENRQVEARRRPHPIDLGAILMCPNCKSQAIEVQGSMAHCRSCSWQTTLVMPKP